MKERKLTHSAGYDFARNPRLASFAAQLDDQLALLRAKLHGLETRHLEWQPHPGMNSIGMLLAHLAGVDVWWISIAPHGTAESEYDNVCRAIIGIALDDDGMPAGSDARHPDTLAGRSLADYLSMLDRARAASHAVLRTWSDADLESSYSFRDGLITREWTVYHLLEHFCGHYGQILLLLHLMRDAGVLVEATK